MDRQRVDQIARSLANGVSRRGVMKTIAVTLGLSAAGALHAPTAAEPTWSKCYFDCGLASDVGRCTPTRCRTFIHEQGMYCPASEKQADCCFPSKDVCEAFIPPPPS
jgi:hypothetical protein